MMNIHKYCNSSNANTDCPVPLVYLWCQHIYTHMYTHIDESKIYSIRTKETVNEQYQFHIWVSII